MIHQIGELEDKLLLTNADKLVVVNNNDANAMLAGNLMSNLCQTETFSNLQTADKTIAGAINELYGMLSHSGIPYKDFTESVFKALNKQRNDRDNILSGIIYYPSDNSYFPIIADGQPLIAFKFTGTYSDGFKISVI